MKWMTNDIAQRISELSTDIYIEGLNHATELERERIIKFLTWLEKEEDTKDISGKECINLIITSLERRWKEIKEESPD